MNKNIVIVFLVSGMPLIACAMEQPAVTLREAYEAIGNMRDKLSPELDKEAEAIQTLLIAASAQTKAAIDAYTAFMAKSRRNEFFEAFINRLPPLNLTEAQFKKFKAKFSMIAINRTAYYVYERMDPASRAAKEAFWRTTALDLAAHIIAPIAVPAVPAGPARAVGVFAPEAVDALKAAKEAAIDHVERATNILGNQLDFLIVNRAAERIKKEIENATTVEQVNSLKDDAQSRMMYAGGRL